VIAEVLIPTLAAAASGAALFMAATALGGGPARRMAAAVAGGLLVGMLVAEVTVDGAGRWWAEHPTIGATVTGVLLLALTVLIVEGAVERSLSAADERRWAPVGRAAAEVLLDRFTEAQGMFRQRLRECTGEVQEGSYPRALIREDADLLHERMRSAALEAAPVLAATDGLHEIYDLAMAAVSSARGVAGAAEQWEDSYDTPIGDHSEDARYGWWRDIVGAWDYLRDDLTAFADRCVSQLGIQVPQYGRAWESRGAEDYAPWRSEFLRPHGQAAPGPRQA
jgi:hypothetical protein